MKHTAHLPLFPLNAVLFPHGPLKLRIFEARYVDMIGRCMRTDSAFGVALITAGLEAGGPAQTVDVGTSARIVDFTRLSDGLLGIDARGEQRFRIQSRAQQSDGLNVVDADWLEPEASQPLAQRHIALRVLLERVFPRMSAAYGGIEPRYEDASWIGMRLAEILPLSLTARQRCLEITDPAERLEFLQQQLRALAQ